MGTPKIVRDSQRRQPFTCFKAGGQRNEDNKERQPEVDPRIRSGDGHDGRSCLAMDVALDNALLTDPSDPVPVGAATSSGFFWPWGPRKLLKRLNPDKENKVNSFDFLWPGLAGFGRVWGNLGLALQNQLAATAVLLPNRASRIGR